MASAVVRWVVPNYTSFGRDGFRFLGRRRTATKPLKGRLAVAQPPGATMAVTGNYVSTHYAECKGTIGERLTTSKKGGSSAWEEVSGLLASLQQKTKRATFVEIQRTIVYQSKHGS
jgi:hypothetical protein